MSISSPQKSMLYRNLAALLKAGISINKALKAVSADQPKNISKKLLGVSTKLENGESFSQAMSQEGLISKEMFYSFKIAEENAFLEEILVRTADLYDKKESFMRAFKQTMAYPTVVLSLAVASLAAMIVFVLPAYSKLFIEGDYKLPLLTRIAVKIADFQVVFVLLFILMLVAVYYSIKDLDFRAKLPLFGKIFKNLIYSDLCCLLGHQLKSGVPFLLALRNARQLTQSKAVSKMLEKVQAAVEKGSLVSYAFLCAGIMPKTFIQLVAVGEETGSFSSAFLNCGEYFMAQAESGLKKCVICMEPIATLTVGAVVGFVALAMLLPLFSLVNSLL